MSPHQETPAWREIDWTQLKRFVDGYLGNISIYVYWVAHIMYKCIYIYIIYLYIYMHSMQPSYCAAECWCTRPTRKRQCCCEPDPKQSGRLRRIASIRGVELEENQETLGARKPKKTLPQASFVSTQCCFKLQILPDRKERQTTWALANH